MTGPNNKDFAAELGGFLGDGVAAVIAELRRKPDYSEFKLAEALGMEVNEVRNFLYKLHNASLASFIKKKDNKIGWYIYYWTFHDECAAPFLASQKKAEVESLKEKISRENKSSFFSCKNRCASLDFDKSFEFSFRCPECGNLVEQEDSELRVKGWEKEADKFEKEICVLEKKAAEEKAAKMKKVES